jgi:mannose-1-phosphate guanylyltransferase/mannose-6-phosphate isomerase
MAIQPVILAGGEGTRLWPLSKKNHPKQFLDPLNQGSTLFQQAVLRGALIPDASPIIIANKAHRFLVTKQLLEIGMSHLDIILEPSAKNTASSILIAALHVRSLNENPIMLVLPCDHFLEDDRCFIESIHRLSQGLEEAEIGLIAITPTKPATQYGYLVVDNEVGSKIDSHKCVASVSGFIEKPDKEKALSLLTSKNVYWNSGVVLGNVNTIIEYSQQHLPINSAHGVESYQSVSDFFGFKLLGNEFESIKPISFDCGVLEKISPIKASFYCKDWDDLGSWESLIERRMNKGLSLNFSNKARPFVFVPKDILVIDDEDILLVVNKGSLQDIALTIDALKKQGRHDLLIGLEAVRPWGEFKVLTSAPGYLVKHLTLHSHGRISLQSHQSRIEYWVVVSGEGMAELNGNTVLLKKGDALTIKEGEVHRLFNSTDELLTVIEIQIGDHLSETDIIRYDDDYQRHIN